MQNSFCITLFSFSFINLSCMEYKTGMNILANNNKWGDEEKQDFEKANWKDQRFKLERVQVRVSILSLDLTFLYDKLFIYHRFRRNCVENITTVWFTYILTDKHDKINANFNYIIEHDQGSYSGDKIYCLRMVTIFDRETASIDTVKTRKLQNKWYQYCVAKKDCRKIEFICNELKTSTIVRLSFRQSFLIIMKHKRFNCRPLGLFIEKICNKHRMLYFYVLKCVQFCIILNASSYTFMSISYASK